MLVQTVELFLLYGIIIVRQNWLLEKGDDTCLPIWFQRHEEIIGCVHFRLSCVGRPPACRALWLDLREVGAKAVEKISILARREGDRRQTSYHPPPGGLEIGTAFASLDLQLILDTPK